MFYIILIIALAATTLLVAAGAASSEGKSAGVAVLALGAVVAVIVSLFFSFTRVDHREVAIQTSFGKYDRTIATGGVHWLKPWADTERFDQTIQTVNLVDVSVSFTDGSDVEGLDEIGGGKGLLDATVRWQISKDQENEGARALWERYRTFDAVNDSLVTRTARDAVIDVANNYPAATAIINQDQIGDEVMKLVTEQLAPYGIIVDSVSIPAIDLEASTQAAVDKIFTTQQDIKRAENEQIRAEIDAETVKIREASGALSQSANQRFCLDLVNNWDVTKNGPLPATFNCALGGSQQEVIVNTP